MRKKRVRRKKKNIRDENARLANRYRVIEKTNFWNVLFARDNLIKSQTYSHIEKCGQPIVLPPNDQGNREIGAENQEIDLCSEQTRVLNQNDKKTNKIQANYCRKFGRIKLEEFWIYQQEQMKYC